MTAASTTSTPDSRHGVFETLDGVRGVAALAVVAFHAPAFFAPIALPSGYLAVDLFFALSGFVLDFAYRARLDAGLGAVAFMRLRLVRLYPLYILGALIGAASGVAALVLGGGTLTPIGLLMAIVAALVILPSPTAGQAPQLFPLNSPAWSLFFELVVNLIFALLWRFLTLPRILAIATAAGAVLAGLTIHAGGLGLGDTYPTAIFGFLRALTSFFVGVALHRLFSARVRRSSPAWAAWLLPLALLPLFALAPQGGWKVAFELGFIGLAAPAVIWLCAAAAPGRALGKVYRFLGAASYAIYVLHYPLIELTRRVLHILHREPQDFAPWLGVTFLICALIGAWAVDRFYDIPLRRWLARR